MIVSGDDFSVIFDKRAGQIKSAAYKGKTLITGGPNLHIRDVSEISRTLPGEKCRFAELGQFILSTEYGIMSETKDNKAVITLNGAYENGQGVLFTIFISVDGLIATEYKLTTEPLITDLLPEVGIVYDISAEMEIESVSWIRETLHSAYPKGHIGRAEGTAVKIRRDSNFIPDTYGIKPSWG